MIYENILTKKQEQLLPLIKEFSKDFYLVGGTALALQIGHRRSIDFDLFNDKSFSPVSIRRKIARLGKTIDSIFSQGEGEFTGIIEGVKITFFYYPFTIERNVDFKEIIKMPDVLTIGAMKAYALGRRAKWKDYVDLYFILKKFSLKELVEKARAIFKKEFNEKLFRAQLSYFEDIDYSEEVEYMPGFKKDKEEIKRFLEKISLS